VHHLAGACGHVAALVGDADGGGDAVLIPAGVAAVLEARGVADGLADGAVAARRGRVRREAALGNGAAVGAVLGGDGHAQVVPRDVAAGGLDGADEAAAVGVVAARREEVGREAVVGRTGARGLRVRAACDGKQRGGEGGEGDRDGARESHECSE